MTDQADTRTELLTRRLALVAKLSALTAEALRLNQKLSGVQMDVLRIELEIGRTGASGQLVQDLHEAENRAGAIEAAEAECGERIAAMEDQVEELDRMLAAMSGI